MSPEPPPVWRATHPESLRWRIWDDGCVVFDCESGQMHLLNGLAAEALTRLEEGPTEPSALAQHLSAMLPTPPDPGEFPDQVAELLSRFDELGLAEPVWE